MDGGSCGNIVSQEVINELQIPTEKHPNPYKLRGSSAAMRYHHKQVELWFIFLLVDASTMIMYRATLFRWKLAYC